MEPGEGAVDAALRETREEIGDSLGRIDVLGTCQTLPAGKCVSGLFHHSPATLSPPSFGFPKLSPSLSACPLRCIHLAFFFLKRGCFPLNEMVATYGRRWCEDYRRRQALWWYDASRRAHNSFAVPTDGAPRRRAAADVYLHCCGRELGLGCRHGIARLLELSYLFHPPPPCGACYCNAAVGGDSLYRLTTKGLVRTTTQPLSDATVESANQLVPRG